MPGHERVHICMSFLDTHLSYDICFYKTKPSHKHQCRDQCPLVTTLNSMSFLLRINMIMHCNFGLRACRSLLANHGGLNPWAEPVKGSTWAELASECKWRYKKTVRLMRTNHIEKTFADSNVRRGATTTIPKDTHFDIEPYQCWLHLLVSADLNFQRLRLTPTLNEIV